MFKRPELGKVVQLMAHPAFHGSVMLAALIVAILSLI
jgi:hypothetical protein